MSSTAPQHNKGLLQFIFLAYIPVLKDFKSMLNDIRESNKWGEIRLESFGPNFEETIETMGLQQKSMAINPSLTRYWLLFLGIAELATVCEESAKQFDQKLLDDIELMKEVFPFKEIRNMIAHWEDYSLGKGIMQKTKFNPSQVMQMFPFMNVGGMLNSDYFFELNGKSINLHLLYAELDIICDKVRKLLFIDKHD